MWEGDQVAPDATPRLTFGEVELLVNATFDDVSLDWVLIRLGISGNPSPVPDWVPSAADLDLAFASLARLAGLGLVTVGQFQPTGEPGQPPPVEYVPERLEDVRARAATDIAAAKRDTDWAFSCWVVAVEDADLEGAIALEQYRRFAESAEDFCGRVESLAAPPQAERIAYLRKSLATLVAEALGLPEIEPSDQQFGLSIPHDEWQTRFAAINAALGSQGAYWTTLSAVADAEPEAVNLPLADDLADIWRDLTPGLRALGAGAWPDPDADERAIYWEWQFSFHAHWGAHAVEALRALQALGSDL